VPWEKRTTDQLNQVEKLKGKAIKGKKRKARMKKKKSPQTYHEARSTKKCNLGGKGSMKKLGKR